MVCVMLHVYICWCVIGIIFVPFYCGDTGNLCNYVVDDRGVEAKAFITAEELFAGDFGNKVNQPWMQINTFARLMKDHLLKKYSLEELKVEFNRLTGNPVFVDYPEPGGVGGFS